MSQNPLMLRAGWRGVAMLTLACLWALPALAQPDGMVVNRPLTTGRLLTQSTHLLHPLGNHPVPIGAVVWGCPGACTIPIKVTLKGRPGKCTKDSFDLSKLVLIPAQATGVTWKVISGSRDVSVRFATAETVDAGKPYGIVLADNKEASSGAEVWKHLSNDKDKVVKSIASEPVRRKFKASAYSAFIQYLPKGADCPELDPIIMNDGG